MSARLGEAVHEFLHGQITILLVHCDDRNLVPADLRVEVLPLELPREEIIGALFDRFMDRAYAVPIYEEPVVLWTNPKRVRSVDAEHQGISLAYEKLKIVP